MTAKADFLESWSRLGADDLASINIAFANGTLRSISAEMCAYLGARLLAEVSHRQELSTIPEHSLPWEVINNGRLAQCYLAGIAIRRAAIASETLAEWGSLLFDSICSEMARRLAESQRMAETMMQEEN
jgi:hypothetical protein